MKRCAVATSFVLTTGAWLVWTPVFYQVPSWIGFVLLAAAVPLAVLGIIDSNEPLKGRWMLVSGLVGWIGLVALLSTPQLAMSCGILGMGIALATSHYRGLRRVGCGALFVGTVSVVQGLSSEVFLRFLANVRDIPVLLGVDRLLGKLVGIDVSVAGGRAFFPGPNGMTEVSITWNHLGIPLACIVLSGLLAWCLASSVRRRGRILLAGTAVTVAYVVLRRFLLLLIAIDADLPQLFWNPWVSIGSFVVLAVGIGWLVTRAEPGLRWRPIAYRHMLVTATLVCLGGILLLIGSSVCPAGARRDGAVAFDEAHGDWESTLRPMDTTWYGMSSTYNYASLYEWLSYYVDVERITGEISPEALEGIQIVVLKTPSIPYSAEEIMTLADFVCQGGGLLVIGDHTNVFGSTTVLNEVLAPFDLRLRYDSTYDLATGSFTIAESARYPADPISLHVDRFEFMTSCSLEPSIRSIPVLTDVSTLANWADYGTRDFFPEERFTHASSFGGLTQAAIMPHGRGRVVVFTDSTCFSNFSMHMDGYAEFVLAGIGLLARGNLGFPVRGVLIASGLALFGLIIAASVRGRRIPGLAIIVGLALAWVCAPPVVTLIHGAWYPLPKPSSEVPWVYFESEASQARIRAQPSYRASLSNVYETFFIWSQRIGLVPDLVDATEVELDPLRPIVLIDPTSGIDDALVQALTSHVAGGGRLLLMGRPGRDDQAIERLLEPMGHRLAPAPNGGSMLASGTSTSSRISPSLTLTRSEAQFGDGLVLLVSDSSAFTDLSLGGSFVIPSPVQELLNEFVFETYERLGPSIAVESSESLP